MNHRRKPALLRAQIFSNFLNFPAALHSHACMARCLIRHRYLTTFLVIMSLLFAQLALASYVCPGEQDVPTMSEVMAAGEPCQGMDTVQPVLCFQHSADMSLSVEHVKLTTPSLPAIVQIVVVPLLLVSESHAVPQQARPEWQHPPPDPVFLATRRLRV